MNGTFLRIIIIAAILAAIIYGLRRIWRDWSRSFRDLDAERHKRDLRERRRADVIELKRNPDGVFRPQTRDDEQR